MFSGTPGVGRRLKTQQKGMHVEGGGGGKILKSGQSNLWETNGLPTRARG